MQWPARVFVNVPRAEWEVSLRPLRATDERAAVVRVAAKQLRRRVFAPRGHDFMDKPRSLWEADRQASRRRAFADVHVLCALDHPATIIVEGDAVLTTRHASSIRGSPRRASSPRHLATGASTGAHQLLTTRKQRLLRTLARGVLGTVSRRARDPCRGPSHVHTSGTARTARGCVRRHCGKPAFSFGSVHSSPCRGFPRSRRSRSTSGSSRS
jgi:ribosomal protein L37E